VRDVARAHVAAADRGKKGERYLLGGVDASFLDVVKIIGELTGKPVPDKAMPAALLRMVGSVNDFFSNFTGREPELSSAGARIVTESLRVDDSKARRELGYATTPLRDMLLDCHTWMCREGILPSA
jgi:nucleoside-diphosphate-sugar epimerase